MYFRENDDDKILIEDVFCKKILRGAEETKYTDNPDLTGLSLYTRTNTPASHLTPAPSQQEVNNPENEASQSEERSLNEVSEVGQGDDVIRVRDLGRIVRDEPAKPERTPSPPKFREDLGGSEIVRDLDEQRPRWKPKQQPIGRSMKAVSDTSMLTSSNRRRDDVTPSSLSLVREARHSPANEKQALLLTSPDVEAGASCYVNVDDSDTEQDACANARETLPLRSDDVTSQRQQRPASLVLQRVHKVGLDVNKY